MIPLKIDFRLHPQGHQGSFGAIRKYDIHTGYDIYCDEGALVYAIEDGIVVNVGKFTGKSVGSPWWDDTDFVMITGDSGNILYGEIEVMVLNGQYVREGHVLGKVKRVLKEDKGKPMTMLHIELYDKNYLGDGVVWELDAPRPLPLQDITPVLLREYNHEK